MEKHISYNLLRKHEWNFAFVRWYLSRAFVSQPFQFTLHKKIYVFMIIWSNFLWQSHKNCEMCSCKVRKAFHTQFHNFHHVLMVERRELKLLHLMSFKRDWNENYGTDWRWKVSLESFILHYCIWSLNSSFNFKVSFVERGNLASVPKAFKMKLINE